MSHCEAVQSEPTNQTELSFWNPRVVTHFLNGVATAQQYYTCGRGKFVPCYTSGRNVPCNVNNYVFMM